MTTSKKVCSYHSCTDYHNRTMFKFPAEKERYIGKFSAIFCSSLLTLISILVWLINAGIKIKNNQIDMNETRFLCDKHFTQNYISSQSRRKMLVHTAIPKKYSDETEDVDMMAIKVVGSPVIKKRRIHEFDMESLTNPKESARSDDESTAIKTNQQKYKVVVVPSKHQNILNKIPQNKIEQNEIIYYEEITDEVQTHENEEIIEQEQPSSPLKIAEEVKDPSTLEGYSEFIFSGEKYVQMPKRIFDAEKQKMKDEIEKYKKILANVKTFINKIDI